LSFIKYPVICACFIALIGCSANSMIVRTYQGEVLSQEQVARLLVPQEIELKFVDGIKQKDYLLDNLALTYELTPGVHRIVYKYSSIWSKPPASQEDSKVEVIESSQRELVYNFKAGQQYTLTFENPDDRSQARVFAETFSAHLASADGKRIMADSVYHPSETSSVAVGAVVGTSVAVDAGASSVAASTGQVVAPALPAAMPEGAGLSRLDGLKTLWAEASADEKKEFLRWAFQ
jgi:uncharacterized protein YccT (UPF0319 family)